MISLNGIKSLISGSSGVDSSHLSSVSQGNKSLSGSQSTKDSLIESATQGSNYKEMSAHTMQKMRTLAPNEMRKLQEFKEKHSSMIEHLQKSGGWNGVKDQLKEGMTTPRPGDPVSFEEFRNQAVNLVINACLGGLRGLGFDPPGKHQASGTPGWDSDIDTPFFAPEGMPEEVQILEKALFDLTMLELFGTLSGSAIDTESYLDHTASSFKTQDHIESPKGKESFAYLELNAASLQTMRQLGGADSPKWNEFKQSQLRDCPEEVRDALLDSFTDVESFQREVDTGISIRMIVENSSTTYSEAKSMSQEKRNFLCSEIERDHPQARALATMSYKSSGLMGVSRQMDHCKTQISSLETQLHRLYTQKGSHDHATIARLKDRLENFYIKLGSLGLLRTSFFDEGYNTQGAFTKICFNSQGQIHQRAVEDFRDKFQQAKRSGADVVVAQSHVGNVKPLTLSANQDIETNMQQNLSSMRENRAMYLGHFDHKFHANHSLDHDQAAKKAFVATSKYSERTLSSGYAILEEIEREQPKYAKDPSFQSLKNETKSLWQDSIHLEQVKRKSQLNVISTKQALMDAIPHQDPLELSAKLDKVLSPFLIGGTFQELKFEETLSSHDFYLVLASGLNGADCGIEFDDALSHLDGLPQTRDPHINHILQACAGLPAKDYPGVKPLIAGSQETTLKLMDLTTEHKIHDFNNQVVRVSSAIDSYAMRSHAAPIPSSPGAENTSLTAFWQEACL